MSLIETTTEAFSDHLRITPKTLVYLTAPWCGPCKALRPVIEKYAVEHPDVTIVKVDADSCRPVLSQLNVRGVPTLIVFEGDVEKARHSGVASADKITELLNAG